MGQHQLALAAGLPGDHSRLPGHHQLRMRDIHGHEMQIVLQRALAGKITQEITDTVIGVHRLHSPGVCQPLAEHRIIQAWLTAHKGFAQAQI